MRARLVSMYIFDKLETVGMQGERYSKKKLGIENSIQVAREFSDGMNTLMSKVFLSLPHSEWNKVRV